MQVKIANFLAGGKASFPFSPNDSAYALFALITSFKTDIW
jgi:hypothetical protein